MKQLLRNPIIRNGLPLVGLALLVLAVLALSNNRPSVLNASGTGPGTVGSRAPEITGIASWINSDGERIADLKGKVVLIDFWTYTCINCLRSLPHTTGWYEKYKADGLVVLGLHAPEFAFERNRENVVRAVKENNITYPVAQDNEMSTWKAYKNQYWPAVYLIDREGVIRYTHFGEGNYEKTETTIQKLLAENGTKVSRSITKSNESAPISQQQTPETYLSYSRGGDFANADQFQPDTTVTYDLRPTKTGQWSLGGSWKIGAKESVAMSDDAVLRLTYSAKEVYLVMNGPVGANATVSQNGVIIPKAIAGSDVDNNGSVNFDGARLYRLVKNVQFESDQTVDIAVPKGTTINAFTFGS